MNVITIYTQIVDICRNVSWKKFAIYLAHYLFL